MLLMLWCEKGINYKYQCKSMSNFLIGLKSRKKKNTCTLSLQTQIKTSKSERDTDELTF